MSQIRFARFSQRCAMGLACGALLAFPGDSPSPGVEALEASPRLPEEPSFAAGVIERQIAAREYHVSRNGGRLQAPNRAHGLRTYFDATGIQIQDRTAPGSPELLSLSLTGVGRPAALAALPAGEVASEEARVVIRREGVLEWYENSPAGLEQGFTLTERPVGDGPLVVELTVHGASASLRGDFIYFATANERRLRYGELAAVDASGRQLAARFGVTDSHRVRILVEDVGATYPVVIDPLLTQTLDTQLEPDQANAELGYSVASAGDVNGDGYADVIVGAELYDAGESNEGAAFVFLGSAAGVANANPVSAAAQLESDQADARFGVSVASAGDVNGDGYADVIVGADLYDAGESNEGAAFVFLGGVAGISDGNPTTAATQLEANQASSFFGGSVASAGDVNGDGRSDVIVGAAWYDAGSTNEGAAFVFAGSSTGVADGNPGTATTQLESNQGNANFGASVASAGDVNADGYADVIVGASLYDNGQTDEGAAFVYHGASGGLSTTPAWMGESNQAAPLFQSGPFYGVSVAGAGDVNGDGYSDVIVGAYLYDNGQADEGRAFLYFGASGGLATTAAWTTESNTSLGFLGYSVASAGDVNADGFADVVVASENFDHGETDEGRAFVFAGSATGPAASASWTVESNQLTAHLGHAVAGAGDVNGDGYTDVIVGAPNFDAGQLDEGAAFVYLGGAWGLPDREFYDAADATLSTTQNAARLGTSVAGAGDVNGDGYGDVIIGAPNFDSGESDEGAAFIFHGGSAGIAEADASTAATKLESNQANALFGTGVAGAGDVNGDGYADVIVGANLYDAGESNEGAAFVFLGSASGVAAGSPSNAATRLESNQAGAELGYSVAGAGDVNGDGFGDVIVGARNYAAGQTSEGAAFVFHGGAAGVANGDPTTAVAQLESNLAWAALGSSVASAGDVNADGYADVVVGAPGIFSSGGGSALVFHGSGSGIADGNPGTADAELISSQVTSAFGISVAGAGDVNADGYADIVVGAPLYDGGFTTGGRAWVFLGAPAGVGDGGPATADVELARVALNHGISVAGAGDVNGDGFADVIVGATTYGIDSGGRAAIFLGAASGTSWTQDTLYTAYTDANVGISVAGAGDVNGDGFADVIVGANALDFIYGDDGGSAIIGYGNGDATGRLVLARQLRGNGSGLAVAPWGGSRNPDAFTVSLRGIRADGRGRVKLEVETCALGDLFGDPACATEISPSWIDVATGAGVTLSQLIDGLDEGVLYHWRARLLYAPQSVTQTGITAPPNPAHGPWRRVAAQAGEADIRATAVPACSDGIDNDGDGRTDHPSDAGCASAQDDLETSASLACDDGADNDGDTLIDFPDDLGCRNQQWQENPTCNDGLDNDLDSAIDMADSECHNPWSYNEWPHGGCGLLGIELLPVWIIASSRRRARYGKVASR